MKSDFGAAARSNPFHKSQGDWDLLTSSLELTTEKTHLNEIFARVAGAIILLNEDGKVQRINRTFTSVFGDSEEAAVGQLLDALIALHDPFKRLRHTRAGDSHRKVVTQDILVDKRLN